MTLAFNPSSVYHNTGICCQTLKTKQEIKPLKQGESERNYKKHLYVALILIHLSIFHAQHPLSMSERKNKNWFLSYPQMPCRHVHPVHRSCGRFFLPATLQRISSPHQERQYLYLWFQPEDKKQHMIITKYFRNTKYFIFGGSHVMHLLLQSKSTTHVFNQLRRLRMCFSKEVPTKFELITYKNSQIKTDSRESFLHR